MLASLVNFAASCAPGTFFGLPAWYRYLYDAGKVTFNNTSQACEFNVQLVNGGKLDLTTITLIGFGVLDILLRLAGLVAVGFVVYGGVQYVLSQGEPDKARKALGTIINALIGLGISVLATVVVSFIGTRIG